MPACILRLGVASKVALRCCVRCNHFNSKFRTVITSICAVNFPSLPVTVTAAAPGEEGADTIKIVQENQTVEAEVAAEASEKEPTATVAVEENVADAGKYSFFIQAFGVDFWSTRAWLFVVGRLLRGGRGKLLCARVIAC